MALDDAGGGTRIHSKKRRQMKKKKTQAVTVGGSAVSWVLSSTVESDIYYIIRKTHLIPMEMSRNCSEVYPSAG